MTNEPGPTGRIEHINVSNGGVPKIDVGAARITSDGVVGDRQANRKIHGGPQQAVCIYSLERIQALQSEGHPIVPGSAGENLTVSGLDWDSIQPGTRFRSGELILEVTKFTVPCKTIRSSFVDGRFERISQKTNPGWSRVYARVVSAGEARSGDVIEVIHP